MSNNKVNFNTNQNFRSPLENNSCDHYGSGNDSQNYMSSSAIDQNLQLFKRLQRIIDYSKIPENDISKRKLSNILNDKERKLSLQANSISTALNLIYSTLRIFGSDGTYVAFNGGKDSVVVLHLFRSAYAKFLELNNRQNTPVSRAKLIYFCNRDLEFDEISQFVYKTAEKYEFSLKIYDTDYVNGLTMCLNKEKFHPTAFILGTRLNDSEDINNSFMSASSEWLPGFLRVQPILYFNYHTIWLLIDVLSLSYCDLYDKGFTSIGNRLNTQANLALQHYSGSSTFVHPRNLENPILERGNRVEGMLQDIVDDFGSRESCFKANSRDINPSAYFFLNLMKYSYGFEMTDSDQKQRDYLKDKSTAGFLFIIDDNFDFSRMSVMVQGASKNLEYYGIKISRVTVANSCSNDLFRKIKFLGDQYHILLVFLQGSLLNSINLETSGAISGACTVDPVEAVGKNSPIGLDTVSVPTIVQDKEILCSLLRNWSGDEKLSLLYRGNIFFFLINHHIESNLKVFCRKFLTYKRTYCRSIRIESELYYLTNYVESLALRNPLIKIDYYGIYSDDGINVGTIVVLSGRNEKLVDSVTQSFTDVIDRRNFTFRNFDPIFVSDDYPFGSIDF